MNVNTPKWKGELKLNQLKQFTEKWEDLKKFLQDVQIYLHVNHPNFDQMCKRNWNHWNPRTHWQWSWRKIYWPKLRKNNWFKNPTPGQPITAWNVDGTENKWGKITIYVKLDLTNNGKIVKSTGYWTRETENYSRFPLAKWKPPWHWLENWEIYLANLTPGIGTTSSKRKTCTSPKGKSFGPTRNGNRITKTNNYWWIR